MGLTIITSLLATVGCQALLAVPGLTKSATKRQISRLLATGIDERLRPLQRGDKDLPENPPQLSSAPWGHMDRRDAVAGAAAMLGSAFLTETIPTTTDMATIPTEMAEVLASGDALVRSLWLGRLAYPTLIVALESGLFEALRNKALSKEELGKSLTPALPGDGRALEAMTSVLVSLGLLQVDRNHGHLEMTEPARAVLLKGSPYFWGPQLLAADGITSSLRRAIQVESIGAAPNKKTAYQAHSDAAVDSFIESMQAHSAVTAEATATALKDVIGAASPTPAYHVLDMAGGSGCFACALTKNHPHLRVTVADLPHVVDRWRQQNRSHGSQNRIDAAAADLFDASTWPRGADVVLLANVIHDWGDSQALEIMKASRSALSSAVSNDTKNRLIIIEQLLNDDRSGPLPAALASTSMLLGDWRTGRQYSFSELSALLTQAGYSNIELGPKCGEFHRAVIATT